MEHIYACRYCGQTHMVPGGEDMTDEAGVIEATLACDCEDALLFTARYQQAGFAKDNIKELFNEDGEALRDTLCYLVDKVSTGVAKKVSIKTPLGISASIEAKPNSIKITREVKDKKEMST